MLKKSDEQALAPANDAGPKDLLKIVRRGATVRRYRFIGELKSLLPFIVIAAVLACAAYAFVIVSAGRRDWHNLMAVSIVLVMVPLLTGILLTAMRRHEFPITAATITAVVIFNFAVAVLSAIRIPISYVGLLAAAPAVVMVMVYANVRFHRERRDRVGLLDFSDAVRVRERLGGNVNIVTFDTRDVVGFERVLIDSRAHHTAEWAQFLTRLYMLGVEVLPWMSYLESRFGRVDIQSFDLAHLAYSPSQIYYSKAKRAIDVVAVLASLPVSVPLGALIWLYIRIVDGGPSFFMQDRRGYGGRTFRIYKFRTMYRGSNSGAAQANDGRILPGCRFLRLMRLDELPQLVNILRGDMSWIGPRPVAVGIAEALEAAIPQYINRQLVLPGLSGWAQVSHGYASSHDQEIEKLSYDLYYVKHISFDLDLLILFKTLKTLLFWSGAK
ncbi:hypothetical protein GCM10010862_22200 [Devosia nitrariae]|uniref:Bacterial sugar transferase domain-containing protein n=1 Tax=Devosia nitrariae TaxID=2071872 RepID=A0ABQ5W5M6_9HYPH|nr:hypothetical protein GCM10010862_22200 [Devosia nitrariae]